MENSVTRVVVRGGWVDAYTVLMDLVGRALEGECGGNSVCRCLENLESLDVGEFVSFMFVFNDMVFRGGFARGRVGWWRIVSRYVPVVLVEPVPTKYSLTWDHVFYVVCGIGRWLERYITVNRYMRFYTYRLFYIESLALLFGRIIESVSVGSGGVVVECCGGVVSSCWSSGGVAMLYAGSGDVNNAVYSIALVFENHGWRITENHGEIIVLHADESLIDYASRKSGGVHDARLVLRPETVRVEIHVRDSGSALTLSRELDIVTALTLGRDVILEPLSPV